MISANLEMGMKEFCTAPLNSLISNSACIHWSQDNKISVTRKENIDILNFKPKITQIVPKISFERCVLTVPQDYPVEQTNIDINVFLYRLDRASLYNMFLDPLLAPRSDLCKPILPEFVCALWSPAGLLNFGQCALVTLTNLGNVQIDILRNNSMHTVDRISELWLEEIKKEWENNMKNSIKPLYEQHKKRVYELHATAVSWSKHFNTHCYLATGYSSGHVAIWRINNMTKKNQVTNFSPTFITKFKSSISTVSALFWHTYHNKNILFLGRTNGIVESYEFLSKENKINLDNKINIWCEEDQIKVNMVTTLEMNNHLLVICIKGPYIIAVLLDTDTNILATETKTISTYFITGIQHIEGNDFLISTISGEISCLKIVVDEHEFTITFEESSISNPMDLENFGAFGLACSTSRAMWAFVLSPVKVYDHLVLKQPSMIKFCTWNRFDPINLLKTNNSKMLTHYWDGMDYMRQKVLQKKMLLEWPSYDKDLLYKNKSVYESKILYWLSSELDQVIKRQAKPIAFDASIAKELYNQISIRHIITFSNRLYNKHKTKKSKLTELELRIIRNCSEFLANYMDEKYTDIFGKELYDEIIHTHKECISIKVKLPLEKCAWCLEDIVQLKCPNSHQPTSCMISLLPVPQSDYLVCSICERVAHSGLLDMSPLCVFCDVPLVREIAEQSDMQEDIAESTNECKDNKT